MASSSEAPGREKAETPPSSAGASPAGAPPADPDETPGTTTADRARSALAATIVPTLALTCYVVGAGTVDGWRLTQFTVALLLVGGVAFGWRYGTGGWDAFGYGFLGTALALPTGFVLAGLVVSVQNGLDVAHLGGSLLVLLLFGTLVPLLMLPYSVVAGLTSAIVART